MTRPALPEESETSPAPIDCLNCGATIPETGFDSELGLARCAYCGSAYDLLGGRAVATSAPRPERRGRPAVPLPKGMQLSCKPGRLEIARRWLSPGFAGLTLLALTWNSMLVGHYLGVLRAESVSVLRLVAPVLHVSVGCALAYAALAGLVNRSYVVVTPGLLQVRHRPLPWWGGLDLPTRRILQLYCAATGAASRGERRYDVRAQLTYRGKRTVLKRLENLDQALFLEQQLEVHLGIRDEPVDGELPRIPRSESREAGEAPQGA